MNRFRSRKKSHEGGESSRRPSTDSEIPPMPTFSSRARTFRRTKKHQPEPKTELNLATVLPSSDEFRTSLLMPNLSARFSMLREQDDPNSKIGKANDDSVLFPKRASRLNIFSVAGLSDVAETSTLDGSIRPPFAYGGRINSFGSADEYGTDDDMSQNGSVMGRSRGGEGNKLFGGRQKVYIIPVGGSASAKDITVSESGELYGKGMQGKQVYDDDVAMSAFQILKEKERQAHERGEEREMEARGAQSERSSKEDERPQSPTFVSRNRKRETASSTTSGPSNARISTAATSVASQSISPSHTPHNIQTSSSNIAPPSQPPASIPPSLERNITKSKRLYGHGLDQQIFEQQSSAMSRLNSIQRHRVLGSTAPSTKISHSRSAANLNDRYQRSGPLYASSNFRANSPPPSTTSLGLAGFDLGLTREVLSRSSNEVESGSGRSPSLSPSISPIADESPFISSIEPNDLGKATALGAFNKPRNQYDEQQYTQRQVQLQQGRETPPLRRPSPSGELRSTNQVASRHRNDSFASIQSRSNSVIAQQELPLKEKIPCSVPEAHSSARTVTRPQDDQAAGSALASELRESYGQGNKDENEKIRTPEGLDSSVYPDAAIKDVVKNHSLTIDSKTHPIYRQNTTYSAFMDLSDEPASDDVSNQDTPANEAVVVRARLAASDTVNADSPTLGAASGLNGLIRAHLRNDSGQSSIYPINSPRTSERFSNETSGTNHDSRHSSIVKNNHPWASHEIAAEHDDSATLQPRIHDTALPPPLSVRARQILEQATALRNHESTKVQQTLGANKVQQILGGEAPRQHHDSVQHSSWQEQIKSHHFRGGSTETEKEREDLANELAERRQRVQDNLKSIVETDGGENSPLKTNGSFALLKPKTSPNSLTKQESPSKAMKMLGLSPGYNNGQPRPPRGSPNDSNELSSRQAMRAPRYANGPANPSRNNVKSPFESQLQGRREVGKRSATPTSRQPSPPSNRANVEPSSGQNLLKGDLRTRKEHYQTHGGKPDTDVRDRHDEYSPNAHQPRTYPSLSRPSEGEVSYPTTSERSQSAMSGRIRGGNKTVASAHTDKRPLLPIQTNDLASIGQSPRASPMTPYTTHLTHPLQDSSPSISTVSTPTMVPQGTFPATIRVPNNRKRSVNKCDISEPVFMSSTSSVTTVNLPPGASLSNGIETPPPVPPLNPRRQRRTTTTQNIFGLGKNDRSGAPPLPTSNSEPCEERSTFSADEGEPRPKGRMRLRKTSSEGGNLAAKARQHAIMTPSPAMPSFPQGTGVPGAMF
ncbi:hypothetical protein MMC06_002890 [Schaereria dolodes]|nr:hypothetical protein [Schaereria dolodes]